MRIKFLNAVMKPGMLLEEGKESIKFHSPPGFQFRFGHCMEFFPYEDRLWGALWKNRDAFSLYQCVWKPCPYCQRDPQKFSMASPAEFKFNKEDVRRWR